MTKSWFVLFCLSLTFSYPSWAADFNKGVEAYQNGNYEVAFDEWAALAEDDDPMSQYGLGILYREGKGVSQDFDEAFNWFELSADQGNEYALNALGEMYDNGDGVEKDYEAAYDYYLEAGDAGVIEAIFNLGVLLDAGKLGQENDDAAIEMYEIAAEAGHEGAIHNLANPLDKIEEDESANNTQATSSKSLDLLDQQFEKIRQQYNNDDNFSDVDLYNAWLNLANQGHPESQFRIGYFLYTGIETETGSNNFILPKDYESALEYFGKASQGGNVDALAWAAVIHTIGPGDYWAGERNNVPINLPKAVELLKKATELGQRWAPHELAKIYMEGGEGVEKNITEARTLLNECVAAGRDDNCTDLLAVLDEQVIADSPIFKLKDAMEKFIVLETCHEMNAFYYVTSSQMEEFRNKMRALQDHYVSLGADPDKAWDLANNDPSESTQSYMSAMEIFKFSGDYNADMEQYCNLFKMTFPELETDGKKPRKKTF